MQVVAIGEDVDDIEVDIIDDEDFTADDRIRLEIEEAAKKAKEEAATKRFVAEEDDADHDEIAQVARSLARASLLRAEEADNATEKGEKKKRDSKKTRKSATKTEKSPKKDGEKKKSKKKSVVDPAS